MGESVDLKLSSLSFVRLSDAIMELGGKPSSKMTAERVIYNKPATIVLWADGTRTVVKCDSRDAYDPKYGLVLCYMKKALGNSSRNLNDALRTFLPKENGGEE